MTKLCGKVPVSYTECQAQSREYTQQWRRGHDTASEEQETATCPWCRSLSSPHLPSAHTFINKLDTGSTLAATVLLFQPTAGFLDKPFQTNHITEQNRNANILGNLNSIGQQLPAMARNLKCVHVYSHILSSTKKNAHFWYRDQNHVKTLKR